MTCWSRNSAFRKPRRAEGISLAWLAAAILFPAFACGQASPQPDLTRPLAVPDKRWLAEHARQRREIAESRGRCILFGDSLIDFWTQHGEGSWQLDLKPFEAVNAGIAGDRVENIHFRARAAEFTRPPSAFVVLAGTNNLGKTPPDPPEAVAAGVLSIVRSLKAKVPGARILLLSLLPSGEDPDSALRRDLKAANALLADGAEAAGAVWLDVHETFLHPDGRWKPGLTLDGTHLTSRGYDLLAVPVRAALEEWLGEDRLEP